MVVVFDDFSRLQSLRHNTIFAGNVTGKMVEYPSSYPYFFGGIEFYFNGTLFNLFGLLSGLPCHNYRILFLKDSGKL